MRAHYMARLTLEAPTVASSERINGSAHPLAVGVFGSFSVCAGRPVLLPGAVLAPGSGTRYDEHVGPGVSKELVSLLLMWRDAVRLLSVNAVSYERVLSALSINVTVCEYMEVVVILVRVHPAAEVWRRCHVFGIGHWITLFHAAHRWVPSFGVTAGVADTS